MAISKQTWVIVVLGFIIACLTGLLIWSLTRPDDADEDDDTDGNGVPDSTQMTEYKEKMDTYNGALKTINTTYDSKYYVFGKGFDIKAGSTELPADLKVGTDKNQITYNNYPFKCTHTNTADDISVAHFVNHTPLSWKFEEVGTGTGTGTGTGIVTTADANVLTIGGIIFTKDTTVKDVVVYRCNNDHYLHFKKVKKIDLTADISDFTVDTHPDCFVMYYHQSILFVLGSTSTASITGDLYTVLFSSSTNKEFEYVMPTTKATVTANGYPFPCYPM